MIYRYELREYIQDNIGQDVPLHFVSRKNGNRYDIQMRVGGRFSQIQSTTSKQLGKEYLAHELLNKIKRLSSEAEIRQFLGLPSVRRNSYVSSIRGELHKIKELLRRCRIASPYRKLSQIYPLLDHIEYQLAGVRNPVKRREVEKVIKRIKQKPLGEK